MQRKIEEKIDKAQKIKQQKEIRDKKREER